MSAVKVMTEQTEQLRVRAQGLWAEGCTYIWMSIPQQLVEHVAEFPAKHSVAGQRKPGNCSPEGVGAFLMMRAQDARWRLQRQGSVANSAGHYH